MNIVIWIVSITAAFLLGLSVRYPFPTRRDLVRYAGAQVAIAGFSLAMLSTFANLTGPAIFFITLSEAAAVIAGYSVTLLREKA